MGGLNNKNRFFSSHPLCTRTHQLGALVLIATTFLLTRIFNESFSSCRTSNDIGKDTQGPFFVNNGGSISWPDRGYGSHISFKIYIYSELEIDGLKELMYGRDGKITPDSCVKGQWGTQVKIHRLLLRSRFRTLKKEEAGLFFVPAYAKCVRMMGGINDKEINQTYVKVLSQMPYFRLSGGRNHIFIFPSGAGAHLFRSWATYLNRSIILTPEFLPVVLSLLFVITKDNGVSFLQLSVQGDRTDKRDTSAFNTWKDIIIPGNVDDSMTNSKASFVQPLPLSKRKYLANFFGRAQGKVGRLQLMDLAKHFPDKLESPDLKFSGPDKLGRTEYFQHLRNAKFCLAPRGESSWTLRFYESFFVECVPVILSDQAELPFQNVIDYTLISIKWPSTLIGPPLLEYLQSIPDDEIERMLALGRQVRCLWVYSLEEPCSAMVGILWELQRKVRQFQQSTETFWLHNGSIVNRNLEEFQNWKPPMPLP